MIVQISCFSEEGRFKRLRNDRILCLPSKAKLVRSSNQIHQGYSLAGVALYKSDLRVSCVVFLIISLQPNSHSATTHHIDWLIVFNKTKHMMSCLSLLREENNSHPQLPLATTKFAYPHDSTLGNPYRDTCGSVFALQSNSEANYICDTANSGNRRTTGLVLHMI
jgi:hypothetical protein